MNQFYKKYINFISSKIIIGSADHFPLPWPSFPITIIQNLCKGYLDKIKKCYKLEEARLEPEYFKKENKIPYNCEKNKLEANQRIIYNYNALKICHKQEIKVLKKEIKQTEEKFREKLKQKRIKIKSL